jgi:GDSL-like Lipase/Acylhydrolase family
MLVRVILANVALLAVFLVPVELVFGTWVRPMSLTDLRRFSIPIGATFEFDTSHLYSDGPHKIAYTRDRWGLRGGHAALASIDVVTIGGSTTEQRYLDDRATWQAVMERELKELGRPTVVANAGVEGQSTVGHIFDFEYWFPLLQDFKPRIALFYLGANDVLRHRNRASFDESVDATSWRVRSATYQLLRTIRESGRARSVRAFHGRMESRPDADFTETGLLNHHDRTEAADRIADGFLRNVDQLARRAVDLGATPIFVTQTAYSWNAGQMAPRGLKDTLTIHGLTVNYADVSFLHQQLNRRLMTHCAAKRLTCFDLASEVQFDASDYYDYLHNTPSGARKIGAYLARRLAGDDHLDR